MNKTCCPQYTIRCDISELTLSKSQKKVIKKVRNYLKGEKVGASISEVSSDGLTRCANVHVEQMDFDELQKIDDVPSKDLSLENDLHPRPENTSENDAVSGLRIARELLDSIKSTSKKLHKPGIGPDPAKPKCRKAKALRIEKKKLRLAKLLDQTAEKVEMQQLDESKSHSKKLVSKERTIEDLMEECLSRDHKYRLEVKTVRSCPPSDEFKAIYPLELELIKKYQTAVHGDCAEDWSEKRFKRFLVDCPLEAVHPHLVDNTVPPVGLGAFHQLYFLDGKLIAVGVLDILPTLVSSKYLFYDPAYSFLSLGTYSSLQEIYFTRNLHRLCPSIRYYYMGYYIHSCQKMRYKGQFKQSYLLCPETYSWYTIEECRDKLDVDKYSRFAPSCVSSKSFDLNKTLVLFYRRQMQFKTFIEYLEDEDIEDQRREVQEYTQLAGDVASRMLLYRS